MKIIKQDAKKNKTVAFKLFLEGYSIRKISEITGINRGTIWDWVNKNKWSEKRALANERIIQNLIDDYTLNQTETLKQLKAMQLKAYNRFISAKPEKMDAVQSGKLYLEILKIFNEQNIETTKRETEGQKKLIARIDELIRIQTE